MNPTIRSGAAAKYNIPAFSPLPVFSPNCCAVLVQMEHWEYDTVEISAKKKNKINANHSFFISNYFRQK